jgi:hypothetical protein
MAISRDTHSKISRRSMLKRLGAASTVAWTAPVITSFRVPAFAQGSEGGGFPYGSCGWRYKQVEHGGDSGFQSGPEPPGFASGCAAFGSNPACPAPHQTNWDPDTDMLLRRSVTVPVGTTNVEVGVAIDNDFVAYWDGGEIGSGTHEGCAEFDSFVFGAPTDPGPHLLAVRGIDRGVDTFLDVRVTIS